MGLTQSQAVHVVSHCPFLLAQYAHNDGSDVSKTAKAFLGVGYTLPKLVRKRTVNNSTILHLHTSLLLLVTGDLNCFSYCGPLSSFQRCSYQLSSSLPFYVSDVLIMSSVLCHSFSDCRRDALPKHARSSSRSHQVSILI